MEELTAVTASAPPSKVNSDTPVIATATPVNDTANTANAVNTTSTDSIDEPHQHTSEPAPGSILSNDDIKRIIKAFEHRFGRLLVKGALHGADEKCRGGSRKARKTQHKKPRKKAVKKKTIKKN